MLDPGLDRNRVHCKDRSIMEEEAGDVGRYFIGHT